MTAHDTLYEAKFEEASALRRELARLRVENNDLRIQNEYLRVLIRIEKSSAGKAEPATHPGQMVIE